jgi:predicted membrane protein
MSAGRRQHNPAAQVVVGLAVIAVGLMFLLDNLGWLDLDMGVQFWPVVLVVAGVLKIMGARSTKGNIIGAALLAAGVLLLLKGLGILAIGWNVLAPVAMIGAGLFVVARSTMLRHAGAGHARPVKDAGDDAVFATAVLGVYKRRITSQQFAGGEITAIMGGCELDLRDAALAGDAVVNVFALMGGIAIQVPADWSVQLEGAPILGGIEDATLRPKDGAKRLVVRGYAIMGGVEIRN